MPESSYRWNANLGRFTYIVRKGKHKGAYHFYATHQAFLRDHPHKKVKPWPEGHPGDYVRTDCGHIVPVLARTVLQSKRRKQRPTIAIRVPHGTAGYYERLDGSSASKLILVDMQKKAAGRGSMQKNSTPKTGKYFTKKKRRFVSLLAQGVAPHRAYMMAWEERDVSRAKRSARALMREEGDTLMSEITKAYEQIFDGRGMSREDIAAELVEIAQNKKSYKAALDAIALILELRGERAQTNVNVNLPPAPPLPSSGASSPISSPKNTPKSLEPIRVKEEADHLAVDATRPSASSSASSSPSSSSTKPPSPQKS